MTLYNAVAGDNKTPVDTRLDGVANLTGATVVAHLTGVWPTTTSQTLNVTVLDVNARTVRLSIGTSDNVSAGDYLLEWQATFGDGTILTWPTDGYDTLRVRPQLA